MKIIVAKTAGFCMGVKRAVDLALESTGKTPGGIVTLGPLIHNRQTTDMLRQRRVVELTETNLTRDTTILIRAHGVPPGTQEQYAEKCHEIIDGTCPKVKTVHKVIERHRNQGFSIIIAGDRGHAEVIGLLGYAGDAGHLIQLPEDVDSLPHFSKVCLVSQTTFDRNVFDTIAAKVKQRYAGSETVVVKKTICAATDQRQEETQRMSKIVDAMIVVGGKESANTQRLAKISRDSGTPTQHVETEQEIDWEKLLQCKTVGVTAGASTPNWMIKRICDYLEFMDHTRKKSLPNLIWSSIDILANLNVLVAIAAVVMYYASCHLQGYAFDVSGAVLCFLYFLSMYLWNSLASIEITQHLGISRYRFYNAHKKMLFTAAIAIIAILLAISFLINRNLFYLTLFATLAGSAYHLTIIPDMLRPLFRYKSLKDIPTSRDLFVSLAWATILTFIPQVIESHFAIRPTTVAAFCWIFVLAYLRSLLYDLRDIEGDRIMGRETLITIVGEKRARKAIQIIIIICLAGLLIFPAAMGLGTYFHQNTMRFLFQIPVLLYIAFFVRWNPRIRSNRSALFNFLADGLFYVGGLGAFIASAVL